MNLLGDGELTIIVQNLQLALDYQYQQIDQGHFSQDEVADIEEYLVHVDLILARFRDEYERRVERGAKLTPLSTLPKIKLSPFAS